MPSVSRVGSLRNKITIQNTDLTTDNHGGFTTGRSTHVTAFAKITPKAGRFLYFDGNIPHCASRPVESLKRLVININLSKQ